ncbi:MAG: threonine synthase [Acidobacteria bacterium]|nr:threonine synthase [Acidobacteriota bacterium]
MRFVSTFGHGPAVSFRRALFEGLAPDGGLYVPDHIPRLAPDFLAHLSKTPLDVIATEVLRLFLHDDISEPRLRELACDALSFPIPLVDVDKRNASDVMALELFHGPTLAFKDVGARTMARLMEHFHEGDTERGPVTVLVATSGDTGGAVADAFYGLSGFQVVVLYPDGQVSPIQEVQFTTLGGNVLAVAIQGSFDDCQRLVKQAFLDATLRERMRLTSANSINVGRLLPQIIYYVHLVARLPPEHRPVVVSVPSGNLGNLTAGLIAMRLGVAIDRFVAATNTNDVMPEYLRTGRFTPRQSRQTLSSAMDVGDPNNFQRIQTMYGGDVEALRVDLDGAGYDDGQVKATIAEVHRRCGYLMDPHSAVGYLALSAALDRHGRPATGIFLATAHPAKFAPIVEAIVGQPVAVPDRLRQQLSRPRQMTKLAPDLGALRQLLLSRHNAAASGG